MRTFWFVFLLIPLICSAQYRREVRENRNVSDGGGYGFRFHSKIQTPVTPSGGALTMTADVEAEQTVNILVIFTGSLTVDWGDGSEPEAMVTDDGSYEIYNTHEYASADAYIITITGDLTSLTWLICSDNSLTSLDVSSCTALTLLICSGNSLTSLDVSSCTALTGLYCSGNSLTESAITALIATMPDLSESSPGTCSLMPQSETFPQTLTPTQCSALSAINWVEVGVPCSSGDGFIGLSYDENEETYTRSGDLIGEPLNSSPANSKMPIQGAMRGCVLNTNGTVNYYLADTNWLYKVDGTASNLTGSDGQVMVEIPKFYYRYMYSEGAFQWDISPTELEGFTLHPAFFKDSVEVDYRYIGAYESVLYDASEAGYVNFDDEVEYDFDNDKVGSVSHKIPCSNATRSQFRELSSAIGTGWRQVDYDLVNAIELLFLIEYGSFDSQTVCDTGLTYINDEWDGYPFCLTGAGDTIGMESGGNAVNGGLIADNDSVYSRYRGIEHFWGHIIEWVDGMNLNNGTLYLSNYAPGWGDETSAGYEEVVTFPEEMSGYWGNIANNGRMFYPGIAVEQSPLIDDYWYLYVTNEYWVVPFFGGSASNESNAGLWMWDFEDSPSDLAPYIGSRIAF